MGTGERHLGAPHPCDGGTSGDARPLRARRECEEEEARGGGPELLTRRKTAGFAADGATFDVGSLEKSVCSECGAEMKRIKGKARSGRRRARQERERDHVNEMLKLCLQKVLELQADLQRSEEVHDPEAAGYAACAMETVRFLSSQGLPPDHPMVKELTDRLLKDRD